MLWQTPCTDGKMCPIWCHELSAGLSSSTFRTGRFEHIPYRTFRAHSVRGVSSTFRTGRFEHIPYRAFRAHSVQGVSSTFPWPTWLARAFARFCDCVRRANTDMCQKLRGNDRLYNYMEVWNEKDIDVCQMEKWRRKKNADIARPEMG